MPIVLDPVNGITQASWTTAGRPASPTAGQVGFNTSLNALEQYTGSSWETIPTWTTSNRPVTPAAGYSGYNTDTKAFEFYNGTSWIGFNQSNLSTTASYLLVAGGGSGGSGTAGGGGAGGFKTGTFTLNQNTTYFVTVGGGGGGGTTPSVATSNGSDSSIGGAGLTTITSTGGGNGAGTQGGSARAAGNGGSGGGGASDSPSGLVAAGSGTPGQGNNGGAGTPGQNNNGGGGGAGSVGATAPATQTGGNGGSGTASSITGTSITYAGGGGGGGGTGGGGTATGGGGAGSPSGTGSGSNGVANTGGGGGGSWNWSGSGWGAGGSGVAIISYPGSQVFTGGTVTTSGGNTIHTFRTSAALLPTTNGSTFNNSLRFRASASAYLSRTPASAGNRQIMTYSFWVKRGALTADYNLTNATTDASNSATLYFNSSNSQTFDVFLRVGGTNYSLTTSQVFRDPSAWYHIVVAIDTTQAVASNRTKVYVNGSQVQNFLTASYVPQNSNLALNNSVAQNIGGTNYYDGYMANIQFIDGQQLSAAYFGTNNSSGVWVPVPYTGTYGTNGFFLNFGDGPFLTTSSNTGIGKDSSGNGNYWVTNNISVTAGSTFDLMTDVPTLTSATVANYGTFNPLNALNTTTTDANLGFSMSASPTQTICGTFGMNSGKWYFEFAFTSAGSSVLVGGIVGSEYFVNATRPYQTSTGYMYIGSSGNKINNNTGAAYGSTYTTNDIIGVAVDLDNGKIWFSKNGTWQASGDPAAGTNPAYTGLSGTYIASVTNGNDGVTYAGWINCGQRPFSYTPPSGYVALNTYNLSTPTILQGNLYMNATAYTGTNGSPTTQVISSNFQPDFLWFKKRSAAYDHALIDTTRGITKQLYSNLTNAEGTDSDVLTAIVGSSFTVGNSNYSNYGTLVAWTWKANGGTTSSNTAGSITSTVQANTTAGFSVITYSGTSANATIGHGLGVAPKMIIVKSRTTAGNEWCVWHTSLTNATYYLYLNANSAQAVDTGFWNSTAPTSTLISLGGNTRTNGSGQNYVCYAWAEIAGFSKFGSYTGNGSADGTFVYLGFMPKYIMIKSSSIAGEWAIYDIPRDLYNPMGLGGGRLQANTSNAETAADSAQYIDFLSNGFKIRNISGFDNQSSATYIYAAFASNPFKYSNAF